MGMGHVNKKTKNEIRQAMGPSSHANVVIK